MHPVQGDAQHVIGATRWGLSPGKAGEGIIECMLKGWDESPVSMLEVWAWEHSDSRPEGLGMHIPVYRMCLHHCNHSLHVGIGMVPQRNCSEIYTPELLQRCFRADITILLFSKSAQDLGRVRLQYEVFSIWGCTVLSPASTSRYLAALDLVVILNII